jgi:hypothetical protein
MSCVACGAQHPDIKRKFVLQWGFLPLIVFLTIDNPTFSAAILQSGIVSGHGECIKQSIWLRSAYFPSSHLQVLACFNGQQKAKLIHSLEGRRLQLISCLRYARAWLCFATRQT